MFHLVTFLQVFVLQAIFMWVIGLSLSVALAAPGSASRVREPLFLAALGVWGLGFAFEAGSDLQLQLFKRDPANRGRVCDQGFFKYTRHPNYFGDFLIWSAFYMMAVAASWPHGLLAAGSPMLMFVSERRPSVLPRTPTLRAAA